MVDDGQQEPAHIQPASTGTATAIIIEHPTEVHLYQVAELALDRIVEAGLGRSLSLVFAAALFGAVVSLFAVWLTVDLDGPYEAATLNVALVVLFVMFVYFGIQAYRDSKGIRRELQRIKGR